MNNAVANMVRDPVDLRQNGGKPTGCKDRPAIKNLSDVKHFPNGSADLEMTAVATLAAG